MKKWVRNLMLWALALTLGVSLAFAEEGDGGGSDPGDGGTEVCQHNQLSDWKSDGERHWKVCDVAHRRHSDVHEEGRVHHLQSRIR